jgi:leader peptidase (prepilin peptidase)/N-methyltransferase
MDGTMIQNPTALKWFLNVYVFVLGAVVGSFLNVCISRLPDRQSIIKPRSRCPKCENAIAWYDNLPIISFIILRAKCRHCGEPISFQYPIVEFLTAALFVLIMHNFTNITAIAIYMVFTCALIVITFIDIEHYIIPDEISLPGIVIGLLLSLLPETVTDGQLVTSSVLDSLIGCIVGGGLLFLTGLFSLVAFKKEGMGGGDVKLMSMVGAFLGWKMALMTIVLGSVFGASVGITLILLRLKAREDYIPFGPYLALGAFLSMMWGDQILTAYLSFSEGLGDVLMMLQGGQIS